MLHAFKLYTGPDNASHVKEGTVDENDRTDVVAIHFKETPAHSSFDWHNDPEPQYVITLSGTLEFTTRDGETFVVRPGDVLVATDHVGSGHKWRLIDDQPWRRASVVLKPGACGSFKANSWGGVRSSTAGKEEGRPTRAALRSRHATIKLHVRRWLLHRVDYASSATRRRLRIVGYASSWAQGIPCSYAGSGDRPSRRSRHQRQASRANVSGSMLAGRNMPSASITQSQSASIAKSPLSTIPPTNSEALGRSTFMRRRARSAPYHRHQGQMCARQPGVTLANVWNREKFPVRSAIP